MYSTSTFGLLGVQIVRGPLKLDEFHMPKDGSNLFVEGSLSVEGIFKQDFGAGHLLVLGDLVASHVVTTSEIGCTGDLRVSGTLYGNCTNYGTNVWGKTAAHTVMSAKEHYFSFWGGSAIELLIDVYGDTPNLGSQDYSGTTMAEILNSEVSDWYNEDEVFELLKRSDTILAVKNR